MMTDEVEDLSFPNAVISRVISDAIEDNITVSKDAKASIQRAAMAFILYTSVTANRFATESKRKTVNVQDIFKALQTNGFDMIIEPLQTTLEQYQSEMKKKKDLLKTAKIQDSSSTVTDTADEKEEHVDKDSSNTDIQMNESKTFEIDNELDTIDEKHDG
ncbi:unnamed protein product [Didymodactylos carnosus]|uniref:DNA polymerase epsilon subunit 3 n=1 Tax=Didymodactylos carnosus TaxID=1234261 RepID=A0A8S2GEZ4_9BILA|nr:unnamed protein product [Didymodactylos carnosus]CAF3498505.1 unnamed protein product [Didymodactylos carnosus]